MKKVMAKKAVKSSVLLSTLRKGQYAEVVSIHTQDRALLRKIMAMGVFPGMSIILIQKFPSYVFQLGNSQFAVDKNVAQQIEVKVFQ